MRIDIVRCDWCGFEKEYDPHNYTRITYMAARPHWAAGSTEMFYICGRCNDAFVDFFTTRTQKVDAK